jgi:hypothetical protein
MSYADLWTNNYRCKLAQELADGKHLIINPPPRITTYNGDSVFPATRAFPMIAKDVTRLSVRNHTFDRPAAFHEGIRWLDLSGTYTSYEFIFPKSLEVLIWQDANCEWYCGKFSHLPNLKQLDWSERPIRHLPALPKTLQILQLRNCRELRSLPALPEGLRVLDIRGCKRLTKLPEIPESVKEIWYEGCTGLLPRDLWGGPENYWDMPKWLRAEQEKVARERQQKRARDLKLEIIAEVYKPSRVEKWLEQCGWEILDMMF